MPERFARAVTALSDIEERLRRLLNLTGVIGTELQPALVTPVVIAADATSPGFNINRGRRFLAHESVTTAAGGIACIFKAQRDVVFRSLIISSGLAGGTQHILRRADRSIADPVAITTQQALFTELPNNSTSDFAPVLSANWNASTIAWAPYDFTLAFASNALSVIPLEIHLPEGWKLAVTAPAVAGTMHVNLVGYVL